jgi:simple sugar transport system permease protein
MAGILASVFIASIHALPPIQFDSDQVVTGTAINILMLGVPTLLSGALRNDRLDAATSPS